MRRFRFKKPRVDEALVYVYVYAVYRVLPALFKLADETRNPATKVAYC